ncbi:MAG: hypothetical protein ABJN04_11890 [Hyphomicrobiales bacterium]
MHRRRTDRQNGDGEEVRLYNWQAHLPHQIHLWHNGRIDGNKLTD